MPPEDITKRLRARPFEPFRVCLTDGTSYVVPHPELLMVGRRSAVLGIVRQPQDIYYFKTIDIDLRHIIRREPADNPKTPTEAEKSS